MNLQLHGKGTAGIVGSSGSELGSSWAVEVGGHLKVCSIIVENRNKNGQMLVEVRISCTCNTFCRFNRVAGIGIEKKKRNK